MCMKTEDKVFESHANPLYSKKVTYDEILVKAEILISRLSRIFC